MILLELFAGTRSIGKSFEKIGFDVYSVDWDKRFKDIDLYDDINNLTVDKVLKMCKGYPDVIWASPDCTTYSIAGISHHRIKNSFNGNLDPVSEYAKFCDKTNKHLINLINDIKPKYYFIENPRGGLRKMSFMQDIPRYTVTYCQYGDIRMKPTDIWTNYPNPNFKPPCKNGMSCHMTSPRGSRNGTQGLKNNIERSKIPEQLCDYIAIICKKEIDSDIQSHSGAQ